MKHMSEQVLKASLMLLSVTLISGCDFLNKKSPEPTRSIATGATESSGAVLCSIDGEAVISEGDFNNNLNQMIQSNPYFRGATPESLPKELLRKFFDQLATQALIEKYSLKNNVEQDPEYIKAYNETEKLLKRSLMVQIFEKKIYDNLSVSNNEISKHYSENKDKFVKAAGGTLVVGARFEQEDQANTFLDKVKNSPDDFEKLANENKAAKFKDFGRVGKESNKGFQFEAVPGPVKDAALSMQTLPGIEKVKAGKEFWVVKAWDKKDTVYFDFDEVQSHIESMLKNNQFKDALEKRVKQLKNEFSVNINEDYFKETEQPNVEQPNAEQQVEEAKTIARNNQKSVASAA